MPQCTGTTQTGQQCKRKVKDGVERCTQHANVGVVVVAANTCAWTPTTPNAKRCKKTKKEGCEYCERHNVIVLRRQWTLEKRAVVIEDCVQQITNNGAPWREVIDRLWLSWHRDRVIPTRMEYLRARERIGQRCGIHSITEGVIHTDPWHLAEDWFAMRVEFAEVTALFGIINALRFIDETGRFNAQQLQARIDGGVYNGNAIAPAADPNNDLGAFVADRQNVHTTVVTNQTNTVMSKYLDVEVTLSNSQIVAEISTAFAPLQTTVSSAKFQNMLQDFAIWYTEPNCVEPGDRLFQKCVNGLWTMVRSHKYKDDLVKRMFEEFVDATGMCCQGHLSRVCNVLVGFEDGFETQLSTGDILQNKMAAIAAKEVPEDQKVGEAWKVFMELNVPMEERMAWLEAF